MTTFIQLHALTTYPPANLNRDDLGSPKTATFGGAPRLRISSQCLKRAWRTSEVFQSALADHSGVRTRRMGRVVYDDLISRGVAEAHAREWARSIAEQFGALTLKKDKASAELDEALAIEQVCHFGPDEQAAIRELVAKLAQRGEGPAEEELEGLHLFTTAVDTAMFGRMLAAAPRYNREAAVQVAHALSVNAMPLETDFFTAVDDLNAGDEDLGSAFMGELEFGAGVFYLYACINRDLLVANVGGDAALATKAVGALVEAMATVSPGGKQASFGSRARASYLLAEIGSQQPRSLVEAFLEPTDSIAKAAHALKGKVDSFDRAYGPCADRRASLDVLKGEGTLADVLRACAGA